MTGYVFNKRSTPAGVLLCFLAQLSFSQVRVPRLVGDGMVLQREANVRIWGWASPGEKVTVRFAGESLSAVADDNRHWEVLLPPHKSGGPYNMDIDGINHIGLRNIVVGDVWLCAGGSDMMLPVGRDGGKKPEDIAEKNPSENARSESSFIRQFRVPLRTAMDGPRDDLSSGRWELAAPTTVLSFSVVAYFFARELYEHNKVPVGLIDIAVADSPAEAWLSAGGLRSFPGTGKPAGLFNGMIAPLLPYTIRGVTWWQGAANSAKPEEYPWLFSSLITDWRNHWNEGIFPFLYVQLASLGEAKDSPSKSGGASGSERVAKGSTSEGSGVAESNRAALREAQREVLSLPRTGMAVTIDLGGQDELHPLNREEIGKRLALAAEDVAYGRKNFVGSGPIYRSMKASGNKVRVRFDEVDGGLVVKGGGELRGFVIAGADQKFVPARAAIDGKTVVVWSEEVAHPVTVRYAWADDPEGANLYNKYFYETDGLAASPFGGTVRTARRPGRAQAISSLYLH